MGTARSRLLLAAALALAAAALAPPPASAGGDWNDAGIAWRGFQDGLAAAKKAKQPVCLVFYTAWCPHCTNYSRVFHDPKVVEAAKRFVMIRLDKDTEPELSTRFAPDGQYIPRTYFLSSDGTLDPAIHAPRENYRYFYDEKDPASLLAGMQAAAQKLH